MVSRVDEHQVLVDEFSRWAEPLDDMLAEALAEADPGRGASGEPGALPVAGEPDPGLWVKFR